MVEPEEREEKRVRDTGSGQEQMSLVIFLLADLRSDPMEQGGIVAREPQ